MFNNILEETIYGNYFGDHARSSYIVHVAILCQNGFRQIIEDGNTVFEQFVTC